MRNEFLPFSRPSITEEDIRAVSDVLRSHWITTGPKASELEQRFRELAAQRSSPGGASGQCWPATALPR